MWCHILHDLTAKHPSTQEKPSYKYKYKYDCKYNYRYINVIPHCDWSSSSISQEKNKCNQCDYTFSQAGHVRTHIWKHTLEKIAGHVAIWCHILQDLNAKHPHTHTHTHTHTIYVHLQMHEDTQGIYTMRCQILDCQESYTHKPPQALIPHEKLWEYTHICISWVLFSTDVEFIGSTSASSPARAFLALMSFKACLSKMLHNVDLAADTSATCWLAQCALHWWGESKPIHYHSLA